MAKFISNFKEINILIENINNITNICLNIYMYIEESNFFMNYIIGIILLININHLLSNKKIINIYLKN
jgi:hypothetical protein